MVSPNNNGHAEKSGISSSSRNDRQCSKRPPTPLKEKSSKKQSEERPSISIRFDKIDHLPDITTYRVRCKNQRCGKKTQVFCSKCMVHLCLCIKEKRNCFKDFHHLPNPT